MSNMIQCQFHCDETAGWVLGLLDASEGVAQGLQIIHDPSRDLLLRIGITWRDWPMETCSRTATRIHMREVGPAMDADAEGMVQIVDYLQLRHWHEGRRCMCRWFPLMVHANDLQYLSHVLGFCLIQTI